MKSSLMSLGFDETIARPVKTTTSSTGLNAVKVVIFFLSLAVISVCLFVFVESYPSKKPSPQYEKAAADMRASLYDAVARIGQTEQPHEHKLVVINGEYHAVRR